MENEGNNPAAARSGQDRPSRGPDTDDGPLESVIRDVESQFALVVGRSERVAESCRILGEHLARRANRGLTADHRERLLALLSLRQGAVARALLPFLEALALQAQDPGPIVLAMLGARDGDVGWHGLELALDLIEAGRLSVGLDLVESLASRLETGEGSGVVPEILSRLRAAVQGSHLSTSPGGPEDPLEALLVEGSTLSLRYLAARILDGTGSPVPQDRVVRLVGAGAADILAPHLEFTRATHRNLVDLTPEGHLPAGFLDSLREAECSLGRPLLGVVIGELGWDRLAWGITCRRLVGVSVDGGFPLAVTPSEAALIEACVPARRLWDRFLVVAGGGSAPGGTDDGDDAAAIQKFRSYNVLHAELLGEILEVAPMTPTKVGRILERLERAVGYFAELFGGHAEDAGRVTDCFQGLRTRVLLLIEGIPPDQPLAADVTRLVQMFEEPGSLDEVRTLHGLKRYLHQQGLRHAFRVFRSGRATNRTVDLALVSGGRVLHVVRRIRYIDFEPDPGADARDLPFPVALVTEVLGRRLIHGKTEAPDFEVLVYGNEVQVFISFRNHPVFLRMDLSPPQRGGMIDVEYFGVSQYELDQHPDPSLQWIQRIFRRLDFDVRAEDHRLHIRYDKERALDLGDLVRHARLLGYLLPHLMELDWVIASLDYPEPVRAQVADAWADLVACWGWLPIADLLTADRSRVLCGLTTDPAGEQEIPWDGRGAYRDRFLGIPNASVWIRVRARLEASGLDRFVRWEDLTEPPLAQLPLETRLLDPLREAVSLGELRETPTGPEPVSAEITPSPHEVERLAGLLARGGDALAEAARIAFVTGAIERHLRFLTGGSVQGYPVQRATLILRGERVDLAVLRDADGIARLAIAAQRTFHLWPGARERTQPASGTHLDCRELVRRLRRDNYLTEGYEPPTEGAKDMAALAALFTVPNALAPPGLSPGDLVVQGIVASPGRAAGFARLGTDDHTPEELDGAILFAATIRPQDAPLIRRSAAVISTGGGILSHAGLIALELHKPALLISGRWQREPDGGSHLAYRYLDYREDEGTIGPYAVVLRRDLREREEVLREGDLVVVDAEVGTLSVLGRDRDALALQQELRQRDAVVEELAREEGGPQVLALRGRWLRAVHQLKKLLSRIDRPALARYAARELLFARSAPSATPGHDDVGGLLRSLLANPACGEIARHAVQRQEIELERRHESCVREALRVIPTAVSLPEILHLRLGVGHVRQRLDGLTALLTAVGFFPRNRGPHPDVDGPARRRLEELRRDLLREIEVTETETIPGDPGTWWSRQHMLDRLDCLDRVLARDGHPRQRAVIRTLQENLADRERAAVERMTPRWTLDCRDGGRELSSLIGGKGANLGEISRILGADRVPPWFAVTDAAFQEIMHSPPGRAASALGLDPDASPSLAAAIAEILGRRDMRPARQAAAIRQLWQGASLPALLADEIDEAYRSLGEQSGDGPGSETGAGPGLPTAPCFVAIRSSAFEEDTLSTSWAGQFDTFLFIRGQDAVREHLKLAMASLWTERAIQQREILGVPAVRGGGGGVVVQRIVDARVAGVLHTLSATAGQAREMVINVGLGLGEGVVSGTVEVDHVVVSRETDVMEDPLRFHYLVGDKSSRIVYDRKAGSGTRLEETLYHQRMRPALEYSDLCELVRAAARLERTYGFPLDIEFAFEDDALYILQVRPIVAFQNALRETVEQAPLPTGIPPDREDGQR